MKRSIITAIFPLLGMLILILDAQTALSATRQAIILCLQSVIPSLFPFLILSSLAIHLLPDRSFPVLRPLAGILRVPEGSEMIWLIGLLGGYPTGANLVANAYRQNQLSGRNAERMLAFCSNAGPAFIFGFGTSLFSDQKLCWYLWGIHILASLIVAILTPGEEKAAFTPSERSDLSLAGIVLSAAKAMAMICCWVIIFRIVLLFIDRWIFWCLPVWASTLLQGILELTNGTIALCKIETEALRFCLFSVMLSFGGLCVAMQTFSLCGSLHHSAYLPGKLLQASVSGLLSAMIVIEDIRMGVTLISAFLLICIGYYFLSRWPKKTGFPRHSAV